jgi:hypothetical protein
MLWGAFRLGALAPNAFARRSRALLFNKHEEGDCTVQCLWGGICANMFCPLRGQTPPASRGECVPTCSMFQTVVVVPEFPPRSGGAFVSPKLCPLAPCARGQKLRRGGAPCSKTTRAGKRPLREWHNGRLIWI